jgi:hypothetical protein
MTTLRPLHKPEDAGEFRLLIGRTEAHAHSLEDTSNLASRSLAPATDAARYVSIHGWICGPDPL